MINDNNNNQFENWSYVYLIPLKIYLISHSHYTVDVRFQVSIQFSTSKLYSMSMYTIEENEM